MSESCVSRIKFNDNVIVYKFYYEDVCLQEYLEEHKNCLIEHLRMKYLLVHKTLENFDIQSELEKHWRQQLLDEIEIDKEFGKPDICTSDDEEID